ncbi:MAG: alcohol dehydrogenase [Burkholderiaceae bacterium]
MDTYTSYDLVEYGKPLQARLREMPKPKASEVLVRVRRSGVCHSDLHIGSGHMDLGEEGVLSMAERGIKLPVAMGHEILGEVVALGPDADPEAAPVGKTMLVFPWTGCGDCLACEELRENDCLAPRFMGLVQDGGYATHALVRHPRYLVDVEGLDPDTVTPHACSGLTVYNALKKAGPLREGEWLAVMGTGGLGLNAIAIARAMGYKQILAVDNNAVKLQAAVEMGADKTLDSSAADALDQLKALTDNRLLAVIDTVGVPATSRLAVHALIKTGRYVCVGLHGGDFKMPLPWLPQKALTVCGCHVGSSLLLRELIELVKTGKVKEIPVESRPLSAVAQTLDDLKAGNITGRVVLNGD